MHGRAVAALHARHAPARQLGPHLLMAPVGTLPTAADILVEAAAESAAAGDHEVAIACLERALTERPGDLEFASGWAGACCGSPVPTTPGPTCRPPPMPPRTPGTAPS